MTEISHRFVESTSGLRMHIAEAGSGPLVLLLHGFPECWYSWRHQLTALAEAGYHAVAPDQRGYARTGGPAEVDKYTIHHLVGDAVGLIDALDQDHAAVVGHDWGASVAWSTAQFRPERVRGVACLSVPHRPRSSRPPVQSMREMYGDGFYMVHFQQPDVPEAEFDRDRAATFRRMLYTASGDLGLLPSASEGGGLLAGSSDALPAWLTEDDIAVYVREYEHAGFTGPLNWYRNLDRNWELTAAWHRAPVSPPALFIGGDRDPVLAGGGRVAAERLIDFVPGLRGTVWLPDCGHWTQQENPAEVNKALVDFLGTL
jgi:pimeloyl-ACP methyl ester carboxylesterase